MDQEDSKRKEPVVSIIIKMKHVKINVDDSICILSVIDILKESLQCLPCVADQNKYWD